MKAHLHFGDNLEWLSRLDSNIVDLCYIDPPFNSQAAYNVIVGGAQVKAFGDTWSWIEQDAGIYRRLVEGSPISAWAEGMMKILKPCGMMSYLLFMAQRLLEIKRVLKPTGSIYVHCDHAADYHLRLLMDAVLNPRNWRNSIVWSYKYGGRPKACFGNKHDTILFYSRSERYLFNSSAVRVPHEEASLAANFRFTDEHGRRYRKGTWKSGKEYRYYADEGRTCDDVWTDLGSLHQADKERLDYPTQKPLALLERIILASSNPGDLVMDCFVGSGTTVEASLKNGRNFIGCDITYLAIEKALARLAKLPDAEVSLTGHPETIEDARELARRDKFQFQAWALDMVGCNPDGGRTAKKGKDSGIDGQLVQVLKNGSTHTTIISVKGGKPKLVDVRDLIGTVAKERAQRGILLMLESPTKDMITTAASGDVKIIIFTAQDLLEGKKIPPVE